MYTVNTHHTSPVPGATPCRNYRPLLGCLEATPNTFRHRLAVLSSERILGHAGNIEVRPLRPALPSLY